MKKWKDLTMKEKAYIIKVAIQNNIYDLDVIRNRFDEGGFLTNVKEIIRRIIDTEARNAESYSSDNMTFDEAYYDARKKGQKTFYYDGNYFNTDYAGEHHRKYNEDIKSGKADAWEKMYPGYTNPELRKAKQEELDLYGITNEQTHNKKFYERNFANNVSYTTGAIRPFKQAINALSSKIPRERRLENEKLKDNIIFRELREANNYLMSIPQQDNIYSISKYKPTNSEDKYYYRLNIRNPTLYSMSIGDSFNDSIYNSKPSIVESQIYSWNNMIEKPLNDVLEEYKVTNDRVLSGRADILGNNITTDTPSSFLPSEKYLKNLQEEQNNINSLLQNKKGNFIAPEDPSMGHFTIGNTDDYKSYYDLNDLSGPFSYSPGIPFKVYDRFYKKEEPDIDSLYYNFNYPKRDKKYRKSK